MRTSLLILILAAVCIPSATAAGPWLGIATNGVAGYTTQTHGTTTAVGDGSRTISIAGKWGLPRVTLGGDVGGLSADGRVLVLARDDVAHANGALSRTSSFAVLGTKPLHLRAVVRVQGDFGFDALSPHGRTLYLIQHVSQENLFRYRVRAYDLQTRQLLQRVVADRRQRDWNMNGYPVARAATRDGRFVYTLYQNGNNYPVVHALDTVERTAVCVGLPWDWTTDAQEISRARLTIRGGELAIGDRFLLDRSTYQVVKR